MRENEVRFDFAGPLPAAYEQRQVRQGGRERGRGTEHEKEEEKEDSHARIFLKRSRDWLVFPQNSRDLVEKKSFSRPLARLSRRLTPISRI